MSRSGVAERPRRSVRANGLSVIVVSLAASLWASDVFFRSSLIRAGLSSSAIVFAEDLLVTCAFLPLLPNALRRLFRAPRRSTVAMTIIAVGPQALATVLFTQSLNIAFKSGVADETYLLQQFQPVIAITLAWAVLRERRRPLFWPLAALGILAVYLVIFAQDPAKPWLDLGAGQAGAGLLALAAAFLWATGTVLGRYVLRDLSYSSVASLRFALALPILLLILLLSDGPAAMVRYRLTDLPALLGLALVPGAVALLLYYSALRATPASIATVSETAYPLVVTLLLSLPAPYGFSQRIYPLQLLGSLLFVVALGGLNVSKLRGLVQTGGHSVGVLADGRAS